MEESIKYLGELGSEGVQQALEAYTGWFRVYAAGLICLGITIVTGGVKLVKATTGELDGWNEIWRYVVFGVLAFIGALFIVFNLPTLVSPDGYAIHQLITDIMP